MNFLISLIPTVLVLGILILIHELGHFIACRLTGVKVEKFSIGFGPEILHWQGRQTRYAISLLPLGGFVKPAGESASELTESGPKPGDYLAAPLGSRIFIVVAGVLMNYLLAFVLFALIFMMGRPVPGTRIGGFVEDYPAIQSELKEGDRIIQLNGIDVHTWVQLTDAIQHAPPGELAILVQRETNQGRIREVAIRLAPKVETVKDIFSQDMEVRRLGIMPHPEAYEFERFGFIESLKRAWQTESYLTIMTHKALFYLLLGKLSLKTLAGPIGIVAMTGSAAQLGLPYVLQLTAILSVSLAVINLLPIPALDGGHLLFLLIEGIRRKSVSLEVQERATQVGFVLLMALMVFIIFNDLVNIQAFDKIKDFLRPAAP